MPSKTASRNDKLQAAHERLQQAVESIVSGDDWQRMLKVASKFHRYSFNNHLMIYLQRPEATYVAGFRKWQELNRFVRKGEKGIAIFAPCKYRTKVETDDGDEKTLSQVRGFRVVHVFDISQTEGEPLADLDAMGCSSKTSEVLRAGAGGARERKCLNRLHAESQRTSVPQKSRKRVKNGARRRQRVRLQKGL